MYLVVIGWLYVVLMMSVVEASGPGGSLLGAGITFLLYGALPLSLVVYLMGAPARRKAFKRLRLTEITATASSGDIGQTAQAPSAPSPSPSPSPSPAVSALPAVPFEPVAAPCEPTDASPGPR